MYMIGNTYDTHRLPWWFSGKEPNLPMQETWVRSLGQEDPGEGIGSSLKQGQSHGQRSLAGYSPWGRKELDMT